MDKIRKTLRNLGRDQRGNVFMIFGFALIPMVFATGMGIDYARAMKAQTKLNAAADAAALAAVSQTMMLQSNKAACDKARQMFLAQANGLPGVTLDMSALQISMKDVNNVVLNCADATDASGTSSTRTVTVTYRGQSANVFGGILGLSALAIGGSSDTYASLAPNIDFYIALDTSPSMALPTTTAGINRLHSSLTCSFACHSNKIQANINYPAGTGKMKSLILDDSTFNLVKGNYGSGTYSGNAVTYIDASHAFVYTDKNYSDPNPSGNNVEDWCKSPSGKDICVRLADGTYADSYWYAINQGLRLRVTDEKFAVQDLMSLATSYASINDATYRAALYTFDHATNLKRISSLTSNLSGVSSAANNVSLVVVNDKDGNGRSPNNQSGTEYLFTSFKSILDAFSPSTSSCTSCGTYAIPNPGNGSRAAGDTPQAFVFIVTDGMSDERTGTNGRTRSAMLQAQINQCNALKARKIRVAILYTEYTYESIQDDEPNQREIARKAIQGDGQTSIAAALAQCASPGLMYTVKTDESITNALQSLFSKALAAARIVR